MPTRRPWAGFILSLVTAFMWGVLPVFFVLLLGSMDTITISWYRFLLAALVVFAILWQRGELSELRKFGAQTNAIIMLATTALVANFLLYLSSLSYLNPESAQVLIQLAPFILMFGSIFFYKEKLGPYEWTGVVLLLAGFSLFFNDRLGEIFSSLNNYSIGIILMVLASLSWGLYGLLQKTLLKKMDSVQLTFLMYLGGVILLAPFIKPATLFDLNSIQLGALLFCSLNLVLAYGAFTEALNLWDAAKVSAVITLAPLLTIVAMMVAVKFWPSVFADSQLNGLAYLGAALVVAGSMLAALGHNLQTQGKLKKEDFFHAE